ncbi:MAG: hypothetical protein AAFY41_17620, partial [Bacteroidota bacterium]
MSSSEVNTLALPDIGYEPEEFRNMPRWYSDYRDRITSDEQYAVFFVERDDSHHMDVYILDLNTHDYSIVELPTLDDEEIWGGYSMGVFSPDMSMMALPYLSHVPRSGCCNSGGIVVVDLASGLILHRLDIDEMYGRATAWVDYWTEEGIWFSPRCGGCAPVLKHHYIIWNPETSELTETQMFHDRDHAEQLHTTGEVLLSANHNDFPLGSDRFPFSYQLNVVTIHQSADNLFDRDGQIVFYYDDFLNFDKTPQWIMGGQAFLVTKDRRQNAVVFRDGETLFFD